MMWLPRSLLLIVCLTASPVSAMFADEPPSSVFCVANASANRDYSFALTDAPGWDDRNWAGKAIPFAVVTPSKPDDCCPLRNIIFSGLNSDTPAIRTVREAQGDWPEGSDEFKGAVLLRDKTTVYVLWSNDINKVWSAVIDFETKRAVRTQVYKGMTSVGGIIDTFDCR